MPQSIYWGTKLGRVLRSQGDLHHRERLRLRRRAVVNGEVLDTHRRDYLRSYLREAHRAIADGVPLKGYFLWSFIDNYEWKTATPVASASCIAISRPRCAPQALGPLLRGRDAPPQDPLTKKGPRSPHRPMHATAPQDRIPTSQKVGYGFGSFLDMWGHWLYQSLAFHVFNIGLKVSPGLISTALGVKILVDAVSDAMFGWVSDNTRSRWGGVGPSSRSAACSRASACR